MRVVRRRAVGVTRTGSIRGRDMCRALASLRLHCCVQWRRRRIELLVGRLGRAIRRGSIWRGMLRMLQRRLRRTCRVLWVALLCALLMRVIGGRAGGLTRRRTIGCAAGVAVHDRAQIHCDGTRGVTTTTSASRILSRSTRNWRSRHPGYQPRATVRNCWWEECEER